MLVQSVLRARGKNNLSEHSPDHLTEQELSRMLRFANAAAGLITTKKGALRSMPEPADIQRLIGG